MKKCILILGFMVVAGCSSEVAKWENAGTLVSVGLQMKQPALLEG